MDMEIDFIPINNDALSLLFSLEGKLLKLWGIYWDKVNYSSSTVNNFLEIFKIFNDTKCVLLKYNGVDLTIPLSTWTINRLKESKIHKLFKLSNKMSVPQIQETQILKPEILEIIKKIL